MQVSDRKKKPFVKIYMDASHINTGFEIDNLDLCQSCRRNLVEFQSDGDPLRFCNTTNLLYMLHEF